MEKNKKIKEMCGAVRACTDVLEYSEANTRVKTRANTDRDGQPIELPYSISSDIDGCATRTCDKL